MTEILTAEDFKHVAEAELFRAQAREAKAKARTAELALAESKRKEKIAAAGNDRNYVLHFEHAVRDTQPVREKLDAWHRLDDRADWTIVMNSPGGSVFDGMALYDQIERYSLRGGGTHRITILVRGMAASMGGILLQAADERVCGAEAYILIHKVSTMTGGSLDDIEDEVAFLKLMTARVEDIFVKRSGGKLSKAVLRRKWARKDWWLSSSDALKLGVIDSVG